MARIDEYLDRLEDRITLADEINRAVETALIEVNAPMPSADDLIQLNARLVNLLASL